MTKATWYLALTAMIACFFAAPPAQAAFELRITEMWPGNEPGNNLTEDWFEVTNTGDATWTAAIDGDLYFDDDSADFSTADLMSGVPSLAPGESAIFVDGDASGAAEWLAVWDDVVFPWPVGSYNGSGLSQGGDGVTIWVSDGLPTALTPIEDLQLFPDANSFGGQSYDVTLAAFSTVGNANNAVATTALNDEGQPAIGSPGVPVPEPSSVMLAGLACACLLFGGWRRRMVRAARR